MLASDRRSACERLLYALGLVYYTDAQHAKDVTKVDAFATRMQAEALREAAVALDVHDAHRWLRERANKLSQVGAVVTRDQQESK